LAERRSPVIP